MQKAVLFCSFLFLLAGCIPGQINPDRTNPGDLDPDPVRSETATPLVFAPPKDPYQTPDPDAPTRTLNPGIPTRTATITRTPTTTPTATPDPEDPTTALGNPWFRDTFRTGSNFYLYDEPQSSFQVENNQMILVSKKANNFETWSLAAPNIYNFYLEATGVFGEVCGGKDRYGLIFRAPDTSEGYLLSISCDGSYRLSTWEDQEKKYTSLVPWTKSPLIHPGPGAINRLGIKTEGITLTGFFNGRQAFEIEDPTFGSGRFGVLVAAAETPGFRAYLSEIAYWALE